mmetsp:Transcript_60162/g.196529  ORF Transcript_60162/g.196529 Transcript_60162/m.196529 type:complete len:205 (+) Transcript_60162:1686-2300(+)
MVLPMRGRAAAPTPRSWSGMHWVKCRPKSMVMSLMTMKAMPVRKNPILQSGLCKHLPASRDIRSVDQSQTTSSVGFSHCWQRGMPTINVGKQIPIILFLCRSCLKANLLRARALDTAASSLVDVSSCMDVRPSHGELMGKMLSYQRRGYSCWEDHGALGAEARPDRMAASTFLLPTLPDISRERHRQGATAATRVHSDLLGERQ